MPDRIIAVFHSRNPDPGKVAERLAARGFELDGRRPCHGEMTREMIESWCGSDDGPERLKRPDAQGREAQLEGYAHHADASDRWLDAFLGQFLGPPEACAS